MIKKLSIALIFLFCFFVSAGCATWQTQQIDSEVILKAPEDPDWENSFKNKYDNNSYFFLEVKPTIGNNDNYKLTSSYPYSKAEKAEIEEVLIQRSRHTFNSELLDEVCQLIKDSEDRGLKKIIEDMEEIFEIQDSGFDSNRIKITELMKDTLIPIARRGLFTTSHFDFFENYQDIPYEEEYDAYIYANKDPVARSTVMFAVSKDQLTQKIVNPLIREIVSKKQLLSQTFDAIRVWKNEDLHKEGLFDKNRYVSKFVINPVESPSKESRGPEKKPDKFQRFIDKTYPVDRGAGYGVDSFKELKDQLPLDINMSKSKEKKIGDSTYKFTLYYWKREKIVGALMRCGKKYIDGLKQGIEGLKKYAETDSKPKEEDLIKHKDDYKTLNDQFEIYETIFKNIKHDMEKPYLDYLENNGNRKIAELRQLYQKELLRVSDYEQRKLREQQESLDEIKNQMNNDREEQQENLDELKSQINAGLKEQQEKLLDLETQINEMLKQQKILQEQLLGLNETRISQLSGSRGRQITSVPPTNTYRVKRNDSLTKIAIKLFNDPFMWEFLYKNNLERIGSNPHLIYAGQKLEYFKP